MSAVHSVAVSSSAISKCPKNHHSLPGIAPLDCCSSNFLFGFQWHIFKDSSCEGTDEQTVPDVRLTKSRDGTNGVAIFSFDQPSVFDSSSELGDITGFYMIDEEGVLQSVDVSAKFVNGKPSRIEAKYVIRSPLEWDRFMRFMERYSQANGLQFVKK
ncbi:hypothetical protein OPV22_005712 [Ensete ventricosum]|uniref:Photosystem II reaction center Psb28 protein n=1 Tax=Ensete ventricosum TaxID=4639 RepID=A0AAV8RQ45_ENSVE|nr:hypothetical protein OPV22_005712 [Ensete ventricosum]